MRDMEPREPHQALSDQQVAEVLKLLPDVDGVELKLSLPDADRQSAVSALGMDPLDAQIRQVAFFDTPDLALDRGGVVVRARRSQGKPDDSVIKLRPVRPDELPASLRRQSGFEVEVDAMPGGFVCSATLKAERQVDSLKAVLNGDVATHSLFSKDQRSFFSEFAPGGIELDNLKLMGPVTVLKLKFTPADLGRKMVAELWNYPDGSRILELSTKCPPADAFTAAAETRAFLDTRGIDLSGEQHTKTRAALDYFAGQLSAAEASSEGRR